MIEEETKSVEETQAVASATESSEHNDVSQENQEAEQRKRNDAEYNWSEMRRQMREKDQQIEELKKHFESISSKKEEDDLSTLAKDDIITVEQAEKLAEKRAKKVVEEVIRKQEAETVEERIQIKFSDYSEVVTDKNIKLAEQLEPEIANIIGKMENPFEQRVAAYRLIKRVAAENGTKPSIEKQKAIENGQKPVSVNSVTQNSAIGNAHMFENGLTSEVKEVLWKEMKDAQKRSS